MHVFAVSITFGRHVYHVNFDVDLKQKQKIQHDVSGNHLIIINTGRPLWVMLRMSVPKYS